MAANTPLRLVFCGTPDFAVPALQHLLESIHPVVGVYTQPDRPAGRGRKLTASPVKQRALASEIPVYQPASLRTPEALQPLRSLAPDLMVVVAYGLILPANVLDIPRLGCWNVHASLLPRWRGAAPIQRALLAGDAATGVCIMQMEPGLDTGPVLACRETTIADQDDAGSLHDRLATLGAELLGQCLERRGDLHPQPQAQSGITYAHKIDKSEAQLDWRRPAVELWRQVRAYRPWPGATAELAGQTVKIWRAEAAGGQGQPGEVLQIEADAIEVAAGSGSLRLLELQAPGKRRVLARDFINAHRAQLSP